jgi:Predicted DNA-binding proteins
MPGRRRCRRVGCPPAFTEFLPAHTGNDTHEETVLTVDEFEAVRLKDLEGLEQCECAAKMEISQPTFHRLVTGARKKVADALTNGKTIKIEGGNFRL